MFGFNVNPNIMAAGFAASLAPNVGLPGNLNPGLPGLPGVPGDILAPSPLLGGDLATQAALVRLANRFAENSNLRQLAQLLDPQQNFPLNPKQMATVIKETLDLPQDFEQTLQLLTTPAAGKPNTKANAEKLASLFGQDVPMEAIETMLKQNGMQAQKQLMKMLQSGDPTIANQGSQVAKLISTLGSMNESLLLNGNKPVETLILLYLPWYPLTPGRQLEVELGGGSDGEAGAESDRSITLYIKTATLGRFRVQLSEVSSQELNLAVWHESLAADYCPILKQTVSEECQRHGIQKLGFGSKIISPEKSERAFNPVSSGSKATVKQETLQDTPAAGNGFKDATRQEDSKQLHIQSSKSVSAGLLSMAYFIARSIFEADESGRLLQQRSAMSQAGGASKKASPRTKSHVEKKGLPRASK